MRRIRFLLVVVLVGVMWGLCRGSVFAAIAGRSCSSSGSIECCGSARCECQYKGVYIWVNIGNCTYGCSGSSCLPAPTAVPINGACGTTNNSCTSGTYSDITDTASYYYWECLGSNGGSTDTCALAKPVNGACGTTNNSCTSGIFSDIDDTASYYYWSCLGRNGGSTDTCALAKPVCNSSNCSNCTSASLCSSVGCYWEMLLGICTNSIPTPVSTTCNSKWPGSVCYGNDGTCILYGGSAKGTAEDCNTFEDTCCIEGTHSVECYEHTDCQFDDICNECVNPGTINSSCVSTKKIGSCGGSAFSCNVGSAINQNTVSNSSGITYTWKCGGTCVTTSGTCTTGCSAVNGVCNNSVRGGCTSGSASAVTTEIVSTIEGQLGKVDNWSCNGDCNGTSQSGCSMDNCTNDNVVNGACKSVASQADVDAHTLCMGGTEANVNVTESQITWDCLGSKSTCAEADGTDALNCSSEIDQTNWFQVNDGNVLAKGKVNNYVPITTRVGGNTNLTSTVVNGKVYSRSASSLSDYDQSVVNKSENSSFNFKTYNYSQIKTDYFDKKGIGTVFTTNDGWSTIKETTGIIFVDGDLIINSNLVTTNFVMIIARGTITIEPTVTRIDAILLGNRVIAAAADDSVESVAQLVINGMVHGVTSVEFSRSLVPKSLNNTSPSVVVNYKPGLLFMVPTELSKAFSQWKVN